MYPLGIIGFVQYFLVLSFIQISYKYSLYEGYTNSTYSRATVFQNLNDLSTEKGLPFWRENKSADRLVLFICDRLSADEVYYVNEDGHSNVPFIRSIIEEKGAWGLSYTRVLTDSRPGHVAIVAGLYEDPQAILWGWDNTAATFDSVFNQSSSTYSFGYENILNLLKKGTSPSRVYNYEYTSSFRDYSERRGTAELLDNWVNDKFYEFIYNATNNATLNEIIKKPKTIFFFHLLGMDVAGHAYEPKTEFYYNALRNADKIIHNITALVNSFFEDDKTSFIFTSDRGMANWGSNRRSSSIEAIVPIVCWGYGIRKPNTVNKFASARGIINELNGKLIDIPPHWNLSLQERIDINQIDISVLMSTLLDIPIPVNSLGILPANVLFMPFEEVAVYNYLNALHMLQQFYARANFIKQETKYFKPYTVHDIELKNMTDSIELCILENDHINMNLYKLIIMIIDGIKYYDTYFQGYLFVSLVGCFFLVFFVLLGEILNYWNTYTLTFARIFPLTIIFRLNAMFTLGPAIAFIIGIFVPLRYLPNFIILLTMILLSIAMNRWVPCSAKRLYDRIHGQKLLKFIIGVQLIVISFFGQENISFGLMIIAFWPFFEKYLSKISLKDKAEWLILLTLLSLFLHHPVAEKEIPGTFRIWAFLYWLSETFGNWQNHYMIVINGIGFSYCLAYRDSSDPTSYPRSDLVSLFFTLISFYMTMMFGPIAILPRFQCISASLGMSFILFATSYDAFFPIVLSRVLYLWITFEHQVHIDQLQRNYPFLLLRPARYLVVQDIRRCFIFIFFIILSLFGIGNLSSIHLFKLDWIQVVITFFPILIIVFLVVCAFKFILLAVNIPPKPMFYIILLFFHSVAGELLLSASIAESWLDIGNSIKLYVLVVFIEFFPIIMYGIVDFCTETVVAGWDNVPLVYINSRGHVVVGTFA